MFYVMCVCVALGPAGFQPSHPLHSLTKMEIEVEVDEFSNRAGMTEARAAALIKAQLSPLPVMLVEKELNTLLSDGQTAASWDSMSPVCTVSLSGYGDAARHIVLVKITIREPVLGRRRGGWRPLWVISWRNYKRKPISGHDTPLLTLTEETESACQEFVSLYRRVNRPPPEALK